MSEKPEKGGYLRQAWLVILLALLYGAALAGVQTTLGPIIAENKRQETYQQIPKLIGMPPVSDADRQRLKIEERIVEDADGKPQVVYLAFFDDEPQGWVLPAGGQGFADRIEVLVGLDATVSTVKGLYVLDQKETPGLGDFIRGEDFRNQFVDKSAAENVVVVKTDPAPASNQITALSGATISSESVAQIVNDAIKNYQEAIRQQSLTPTE